MSARPRRVRKAIKFYPFAYLRGVAVTAFEAAKSQVAGSSHQKIAAVVFSAFTMEAYLNHLGSELFPEWNATERAMGGARRKLDRLATHLGVTVDYKGRPFKTFLDVFRFRDKMAHGKTYEATLTRKVRKRKPEEARSIDPPWLQRFWSEAVVSQVLDDSLAIIEILHRAASLDVDALQLMGDAVITELQ